jgi:hypothetical protein
MAGSGTKVLWLFYCNHDDARKKSALRAMMPGTPTKKAGNLPAFLDLIKATAY